MAVGRGSHLEVHVIVSSWLVLAAELPATCTGPLAVIFVNLVDKVTLLGEVERQLDEVLVVPVSGWVDVLLLVHLVLEPAESGQVRELGSSLPEVNFSLQVNHHV